MGYTCDYCGEPIEDDIRRTRLSVYGRHWLHREYHTEDCVDVVLNAILEAVGSRPTSQAEERHQRTQDAWRGLDVRVKQARILNALADDGLTCREIAARLTQDAGEGVHIFDSELAGPLKRLLAAGEVSPGRKSRVRLAAP